MSAHECQTRPTLRDFTTRGLSTRGQPGQAKGTLHT